MIEKIEGGSDYGALAEVWLASVRATHDFLSEEDVEFYYRKIPAEYMPSVDIYAIRDIAGEWVAFIGLSTDNIEMLFVRPDEMGRGHGAALLGFAVGDRKIRKVDVNEQNHAALGFYLKHGFSIVGRDEKDGEGRPYPILHLEYL